MPEIWSFFSPSSRTLIKIVQLEGDGQLGIQLGIQDIGHGSGGAGGFTLCETGVL